MNEEAVVAAALATLPIGDRRQVFLANIHPARPTLSHRLKQRDGVSVLIGNDQVVTTVLVNIDETNAVIAPLEIYQGGRSERQQLPSFFLIGPGERGTLSGVRD